VAGRQPGGLWGRCAANSATKEGLMSLGGTNARAALAAVGVLVAMAFGAVSASAATTEFKYTGAEQTFVVPAGVTTVNVTGTGGAGGTGETRPTSTSPAGVGGRGAVVNGYLSVTAGQTLYVEVGPNGTTSSGGGGFGGGAADVRTISSAAANSLESRLIVAAGGGGGGIGNCEGEPDKGGAGGNAAEPGIDGTPCQISGAYFLFGGGGGGAGTSTAGGAGGSSTSFGIPGEAGQLGKGGKGSNAGSNVGGEGGAGLYGGGGGGYAYNGGGGGGGSNLVPTAGTATTAAAGAEPKVTITYTPLPTSIEQCKKNGWKNYGTMFKNQGQCVKFVEEHA